MNTEEPGSVDVREGSKRSKTGRICDALQVGSELLGSE